MGRSMPDGQSVLCPRKGVMRMDDKCRRFSYDPLKRTPDVSPELPVYREEDFKIDSKT